MIGFAFALFYALCGIFIARWADRGVRRNILVLALVIWSAMTAFSGAARNFWHLFAARVGVGAGEAGCFPSGHSMLCDYVPLERRPVAFAVNQEGISAGILFGMALAGWLGEAIGWHWTFVALGFPGVVLAALVWLTLREPGRGRFDAVKQVSVSMVGRSECCGVVVPIDCWPWSSRCAQHFESSRKSDRTLQSLAAEIRRGEESLNRAVTTTATQLGLADSDSESTLEKRGRPKRPFTANPRRFVVGGRRDTHGK